MNEQVIALLHRMEGAIRQAHELQLKQREKRKQFQDDAVRLLIQQLLSEEKNMDQKQASVRRSKSAA